MKKTLEQFLNWLKEVKERVTSWETTLIGVLIIIVTSLAAINVIPKETAQKLAETLEIAVPSIINILAAFGSIAGVILGFVKIWEKKKG